jgi:hypothetical protein
MNAPLNYYSAIELELGWFQPPRGMTKNFTQTWEKINEDLVDDEDFGLALNRSGFLKDVAGEIKSRYQDPGQQVVAAYNYIRESMKWDERSRIYVTTSLRDSFDKKSGSSADINLMLVAILKELGIDSDPVIISTRSNGIIHPAQMMLNQFNYVIASARLGNKSFLMDATSKTCPCNMLPERCINGQGRVISKTRPGWIDLKNSCRYSCTSTITASIDADGSMKGTLQHEYIDIAAIEKRIEISNKKDTEEYIRDLEKRNPGMQITGHEIFNLDSIDKPYSENLEVVITDHANPSVDLITFNPMLLDQWASNPFKPEKREFPVDFIYPRVYKTTSTFTLPEGFKVDEKPGNQTLTAFDGKVKFTFRITVTGDKLQCATLLDIGKPVFNSLEYPDLRSFFNKMVSCQAEKVVLVKSL